MGLSFAPDSENVHKLLPTYCYGQPVVTFPDGYVSRYPFGKVLRSTGYKLSNTDEYKELISLYKDSTISDEQLTVLRNGII